MTQEEATNQPVTPEELLDVAGRALQAYHFGGKSAADAADDLAFAANSYHSDRAEEVARNALRRLKGLPDRDRSGDVCANPDMSDCNDL